MTQAFNLSQLANKINANGELDASTGLYNQVPAVDGGTGRSALTANNVILGNGTSPVNFVAPGTAGNFLTSTGTTWTSQTVPLAPIIQQQTIASGSGSWNKPTTGNYQWLQIEIWAGGGSGGKSNISTNGASGGGGGAYNAIVVPLSYLASSESYTVGAGGSAVTGASLGNTGGFSSFAMSNYPGGAETLFAYGGGGGNFRSGNDAGGSGGGGIASAGQIGPSTAGGIGGTWPGFGGSGGTSATASAAQDSIYGGGGGGGGTATLGSPGGNSYYGGGGSSNVPGSVASPAIISGASVYGGGGGGSTSAGSGAPGAGGSSKFGGAGGAAVNTTNGISGTVPSGGGGATRTGAASGAGGDGQIRLTWW